MPQYLVAPYLFQTKIRFERRAKALPHADIDGQGLSLAQAVENVAAGMLRREEPYRDLSDTNKVFALDHVKAVAPNAYLLYVEPGWKGLQSDLRDSAGSSVFQRATSNSEHVKLRHLVYFVPNSYSAVVFAERYGRMGAVSFVRNALTSALREARPNLSLHIDPLTNLNGIENAHVKGMTFVAPRKHDPSGNLLDWAPRMEIRFRWNDRKISSLLTQDKKIDAEQVFGVLRNEARDFGLTSPADVSDWDALLKVKTASGSARTFSVHSTGPGLVYPITLNRRNSNVGDDSYPSDADFLETCQLALGDLSGQFEIDEQTRIPGLDQFRDWDGSSATAWEVTHYDNPESSRDT
ncbi:hypothetical protein AB0N65_11750 [Paenarthrobacter sp. NPDC089322]|uniref:hypothetical protein n=1 Tax=Paenarthrobacter sp. NPDC089322 TaxID=3155065 RepID=UPI00341C05F7